MRVISAHEARAFLRRVRGSRYPLDATLLANVQASLVLTEDTGDPQSLAIVSDRGRWRTVKVFAEAPDEFSAYLGAIPISTLPTTYLLDQAWMVDVANQTIPMRLEQRIYDFIYAAGCHNTDAACASHELTIDDIGLAREHSDKHQSCFGPGHPARLDTALGEQAKGKQVCIFGLVEGGVLRSYARVETMDTGSVSPDFWEVAHIWTDEEHRGKGLATDCLAGALAWVTRRGNPLYYSGVSSENVASQKTCQKLGFTLCMDTGLYVGAKA